MIISFVTALTTPNTLILLRPAEALINSRFTHHNAQIKGCNIIEYGVRTFSWVECNETKVSVKDLFTSCQRFVYITNATQTNDIVIATADSGRLRWRIENEGFNTQKNLGYDLEHKYSRVSYTAMQNYYQLLQIAHMINQFVECSKEVVELIMERSKQTMLDLWKKLIAYLLMNQCETNDLCAVESG